MRANGPELKIAVIGTGIAGMSAAWLLSQAHRVTVYEQDGRIGGHTNTCQLAGPHGLVPVDMGFIVYNEATYPNLTALFRHLGVATQESEMSFAVSARGGALEYAGTDLGGLFAQRRNLVSPRFWSMLRDLRRFYAEAPRLLDDPDADALSIGEYLHDSGYGQAFVQDHLLPMAAAIWSTSSGRTADHPAGSFIRFCHNHGLLRVRNRPQWRTVTGGSAAYAERLTARYAERIRIGCGATRIERHDTHVQVYDSLGGVEQYDHVVIAAHSDQALAILADPSEREAELLGAVGYGDNAAIMHTDASLMPRRRRVWSSWNYLATQQDEPPCVTYWMNRLQSLQTEQDIFVTLNPPREPAPGSVIHRETYAHPVLDAAAVRAQKALWSLQGVNRTWFCGAWFGAGFHEDGLQSGLAVAETLGGVRRPWTVANESSRIHLGPIAKMPPGPVLAA